MKEFLEKYGDWGVIAGGAEGLGEAFSTAMAQRGMNIVMVDNQKESMVALSARIEQEYDVKVIQSFIDLSDADAADRIMDTIDGLNCRLLIYNAAFSRVKLFLKTSESELEKYFQVNVRTQMLLIRKFSERLVVMQEKGGVLVMSSLGGIWGTRLLVPYGSTKAFTHIMAEALHQELKPFGIDVMACVAGATSTPAYLGTNPKPGWPGPHVQTPGMVAREALRNLGKKAFYISGRQNRLNYFLMTRILGRKMTGRLFNRTMEKMYPAESKQHM